MFDELQRLKECDALARLLAHYAEAGKEDRTVWQDRLMALDGVEPAQLVRLHGELLGQEWLEMNLGCTGNNSGVVANCYRITHGGLRALRQAQAGDAEEESQSTASEPDRSTVTTKPGRRRQFVSRKPASGEPPCSRLTRGRLTPS